MTRLTAVVVFVCALALSISAADARPRHKHTRILNTVTLQCDLTNDGRQVCRGSEKRIHDLPRVTDANGSYASPEIIGGRPAGCPKAYCGCGLARYLGLEDRRLNRAWSWAQLFPRSHPAPGMAVVWPHHVALIESMVGPREALLRDYNSGGGLSRLHVRSIAGAVVVNPRSRVAMR